MMICMSENKRFWVENEKILNTYVIRIFKEDEIIFEINNWNSLNESNKVECEGIANELNKLSDENEELRKDNGRLRLKIESLNENFNRLFKLFNEVENVDEDLMMEYMNIVGRTIDE